MDYLRVRRHSRAIPRGADDVKLFAVQGAAAVGGAAATGISECLGMKATVEGQFLPGRDSPQAEQEDAPSDPPDQEVRIATMVYVFGSCAAEGSVDAPVTVEANHGKAPGARTPANFAKASAGLLETEAFSGALDHFAPGGIVSAA